MLLLQPAWVKGRGWGDGRLPTSCCHKACLRLARCQPVLLGIRPGCRRRCRRCREGRRAGRDAAIWWEQRPVGRLSQRHQGRATRSRAGHRRGHRGGCRRLCRRRHVRCGRCLLSARSGGRRVRWLWLLLLLQRWRRLLLCLLGSNGLKLLPHSVHGVAQRVRRARRAGRRVGDAAGAAPCRLFGPHRRQALHHAHLGACASQRHSHQLHGGGAAKASGNKAPRSG